MDTTVVSFSDFNPLDGTYGGTALPFLHIEGPKVRDLWVLGDVHGLSEKLAGA